MCASTKTEYENQSKYYSASIHNHTTFYGSAVRAQCPTKIDEEDAPYALNDVIVATTTTTSSTTSTSANKTSTNKTSTNKAPTTTTSTTTTACDAERMRAIALQKKNGKGDAGATLADEKNFIKMGEEKIEQFVSVKD